jgi:hypothetical protein
MGHRVQGKENQVRRTKVKLVVLGGDRTADAEVLDMIEDFGHDGDVEVKHYPVQPTEYVFTYEELDAKDKVLGICPEGVEGCDECPARHEDGTFDDPCPAELDAAEKNAQQTPCGGTGEPELCPDDGTICNDCPHRELRPCPGELMDKADEDAV